LQDLEDFIAGAGEEGFVLVSLGTSKSISSSITSRLLEALRRLPFKVILFFVIY
jgi:hypothetical protein